MKKVRTIDKGPLKVIESFMLKGVDRRATFKLLEDNTLVITYATLVDKKKKIVSSQRVRLTEEAAFMTCQGILEIFKPDLLKPCRDAEVNNG